MGAGDDDSEEEEVDYGDYGDSEGRRCTRTYGYFFALTSLYFCFLIVPSLTASGEIVATTILTTTTTTTTTVTTTTTTTSTTTTTTTTREATNGQQPRPRAPKQLADTEDDDDDDEFEVVGIDEGLLGGQEDPVELPEEEEEQASEIFRLYS